MALSLTLYQPYTPVRFLSGYSIYDPRGNSSPFLYSFSDFRIPDNANIWVLNRNTGTLTRIDGDFNGWSTLGPADMAANGDLWWIGNEPGNLTQAKQAQTKFAHDTFTKVGSVTTDGTTISYPVSGAVRVDRRSGNNLVAHVTLSPLNIGNVIVWDATTRIINQVYSFTDWTYRFIDFDFDADGNLWVLSGDNTHTFLTMATPGGLVTTVADLSSSLAHPFVMKYLAADNSIIVANGSTDIVKWDILGGVVSATMTTAVNIDSGQGEQQSFHHTLDSVTDLYIVRGFFVHQIDLLNMVNGTVTDFTTEINTAGVIFSGFSQAYLGPLYKFNGGACFYDPANDALWVEEAQSGCIGRFSFGGAIAPAIRTTQILAEIVMRPHPPTGPVLPPPPLVFTEKNLVALIGPAQPMEVCSGYIGKPAVLSQLSQVEAHYNKDLAPVSSELHVFHTEQIGEADIQGKPGVIWKENPWFNMRQTDRYHRVCLFCVGDTEVTALTWMLREAGIR